MIHESMAQLITGHLVQLLQHHALSSTMHHAPAAPCIEQGTLFIWQVLCPGYRLWVSYNMYYYVVRCAPYKHQQHNISQGHCSQGGRQCELYKHVQMCRICDHTKE